MSTVLPASPDPLIVSDLSVKSINNTNTDLIHDLVDNLNSAHKLPYTLKKNHALKEDADLLIAKLRKDHNKPTGHIFAKGTQKALFVHDESSFDAQNPTKLYKDFSALFETPDDIVGVLPYNLDNWKDHIARATWELDRGLEKASPLPYKTSEDGTTLKNKVKTYVWDPPVVPKAPVPGDYLRDIADLLFGKGNVFPLDKTATSSKETKAKFKQLKKIYFDKDDYNKRVKPLTSSVPGLDALFSNKGFTARFARDNTSGKHALHLSHFSPATSASPQEYYSFLETSTKPSHENYIKVNYGAQNSGDATYLELLDPTEPGYATKMQNWSLKNTDDAKYFVDPASGGTPGRGVFMRAIPFSPTGTGIPAEVNKAAMSSKAAPKERFSLPDVAVSLGIKERAARAPAPVPVARPFLPWMKSNKRRKRHIGLGNFPLKFGEFWE